MAVAIGWFVAGVVLATLVTRHLPAGDGTAAHALKAAASVLGAFVMVGALVAVPLALVLVVATSFAEGVPDWIDRNPAAAGLLAAVAVALATDRVVAAAAARRGG